MPRARSAGLVVEKPIVFTEVIRKCQTAFAQAMNETEIALAAEKERT